MTIFCRRLGKIKAIAKGSRKILSKMAGHLEPYNLVNLGLAEGKTFYIVTSANLLENFSKIAVDNKKIARAYYVGEILDRFFRDDESHPYLFDLFADYLRILNDENDELIDSICVAKILAHLGFSPELSSCVHCQQKLTPDQNFWDGIEGGVICASCQNKFSHGKEIDNDIIKILRLIFAPDFSISSKIAISDKQKKQTENILEDFVENILERELKSKKFMKEVVK